jgi:hypothetical protein
MKTNSQTFPLFGDGFGKTNRQPAVVIAHDRRAATKSGEFCYPGAKAPKETI